jgi:hypothetical protein
MTTPEAGSFIEGLKSFLVWVAGALAGMTAILYTCGYLVTRSHLAMLGLYGLVDFDSDHFLQEGAKFAITVAYMALRPLLSIVVLLGLVLLLVRALGSVLAQRSAGGWLLGRVRAISTLVSPSSRRKLAYLLCLGALLTHATLAFDYFESPLHVTNLLYADPAVAKPGSLDALVLAGERSRLRGRFEGLLWGTVLAALLMLTAWRTMGAGSRTLQSLQMMPFGVTLALYLVTLPMDYGVLERSVVYGVVSFTTEPGSLPVGGSLYLLDKKSDGFVVWDKSTRRVVWVPVSKILRAELRAVEPLFTKGVKP